MQSQRKDTTMGSSESTPNVGEEPATSMLTSALLAHQLPPLGKVFMGVRGIFLAIGWSSSSFVQVCQWYA